MTLLASGNFATNGRLIQSTSVAAYLLPTDFIKWADDVHLSATYLIHSFRPKWYFIIMRVDSEPIFF